VFDGAYSFRQPVIFWNARLLLRQTVIFSPLIFYLILLLNLADGDTAISYKFNPQLKKSGVPQFAFRQTPIAL